MGILLTLLMGILYLNVDKMGQPDELLPLIRPYFLLEISGIREMNVSPFSEYYEFWYEQPLDHENPSAGTFKQRVLLGHKKEKAPVIVELEGYGIALFKKRSMRGSTSFKFKGATYGTLTSASSG